jgi:hypothetical protein
MAAYAALARIGRTDPVLTIRDLDVDAGDPPDDRGLPSDAPTVIERGVQDDSMMERLRDRLGRAGELAGQMTFFLFDAESWRR